MVQLVGNTLTALRVFVGSLGSKRGIRSPRLRATGVLGLALIGISLVATACGDGLDEASVPEPSQTSTSALTPPAPTPVIFFPQQAPRPQQDAPTSYITGKLVEVGGCLRLVDDHSGANFLLLWSPNVTLSLENGTMQILDSANQVVAQVGDEVFISGGEIPASSSSWLSERLREPLPDACPGPYWFVGSEIRTN